MGRRPQSFTALDLQSTTGGTGQLSCRAGQPCARTTLVCLPWGGQWTIVLSLFPSSRDGSVSPTLFLPLTRCLSRSAVSFSLSFSVSVSVSHSLTHSLVVSLSLSRSRSLSLSLRAVSLSLVVSLIQHSRSHSVSHTLVVSLSVSLVVSLTRHSDRLSSAPTQGFTTQWARGRRVTNKAFCRKGGSDRKKK